MAKILHVDKWPFSRRLVAEILTTTGQHEVVSAASVEEATAIVAKHQFDVELWHGTDPTFLEAAILRHTEAKKKVLILAQNSSARERAEKLGIAFLSQLQIATRLTQAVHKLLAT